MLLRLTVQGDLGAVLQAAAQHHAINLTTREPSLEEIFLQLTASEQRDKEKEEEQPTEAVGAN